MVSAGTVYSTEFQSWKRSLGPLLDAAGLKERINSSVGTILVKPNLVEALLPPITTPAGLIEALVVYLQAMTDARIIIGEGSGAMHYETWHCFQELGYTELARKLGVELVDLNEAELVLLKKNECRRWPEMYLPRLAFDSFLISVPVLKAHTLAGVTLTLKNMMGLAPPSHYRQGSSWKKSAFHDRIQDAVADLNRYRTPDFTLLDATVGMSEAHLCGPTCDPPVNKLAAGYDPVAIDSYGTGLLRKNWKDIGHIRSLHGELGTAEPLDVIEVR